MNRTVKLYRSVKRSTGWGTKPVADNQLKNLKDLPEGEDNYYLAYYLGKSRQMPSVGRFADIAKQKLVQKRKELDAKATGVELPPEPQPLAESSISLGSSSVLGATARLRRQRRLRCGEKIHHRLP
jgi:hypothetical protein